MLRSARRCGADGAPAAAVGASQPLNHCIYSFDPEGGSARTILMRIAAWKSEIRMGRVGLLDRQAIEDVSDAIDKLGALNREIWSSVKAHGFPT